MSGIMKTPKMPDIKPPTPMPDADDEQITRARRRGVASEQAKSGFKSTILSAGGRETMGG